MHSFFFVGRKRSGIRARQGWLAVLAAVVLAGPVRADSSGWQVQTVDQMLAGAGAGGFVSLSLDATGRPHISYVDMVTNDGTLKYATLSGSAWQTQTLASGKFGYFNSLAIDSRGRPRIAYSDWNLPSAVRCTAWDGAAWQTQTVASGMAGGFVSLALDGNDQPHVVYSERATGSILHDVTGYGSTWQDQPMGVSAAWVGPIVLNSAGQPCFCSCGGASGTTLKYAARNGGAWQVQVIDSSADQAMAGLAFTREGSPRISYEKNQQLHYAIWDGLNWQDSTVTSASSFATPLALDSAGRPHIAYRDVDSTLKYASWIGSTWDIQTIVGTGSPLFMNLSLVLDRDDRPHLAYTDWNTNALVYATGPVVAPEPASVALLVVGLAGLAWRGPRRTPTTGR